MARTVGASGAAGWPGGGGLAGACWTALPHWLQKRALALKGAPHWEQCFGGAGVAETDAPHTSQNLALTESAARHCGQVVGALACWFVLRAGGSTRGISTLGNGPKGVPSGGPPPAFRRSIPQVGQNDWPPRTGVRHVGHSIVSPYNAKTTIVKIFI
jgi:hypothetical protein